jgi:hypothetical protein
VNWLKEFSRRRNLLAHAGVGSVQIRESDAERSIAFFQAFAPVLAGAVEAALNQCVKK